MSNAVLSVPDNLVDGFSRILSSGVVGSVASSLPSASNANNSAFIGPRRIESFGAGIVSAAAGSFGMGTGAGGVGFGRWISGTPSGSFSDGAGIDQ
ncbi:unnamed protein product, partial [Protopolystoma xenopodis]